MYFKKLLIMKNKTNSNGNVGFIVYTEVKYIRIREQRTEKGVTVLVLFSDYYIFHEVIKYLKVHCERYLP